VDAEPDAIALSSTVRRREGLAAVRVDGETVVYDPTARLLHHLDAIATAIWDAVDPGAPLGEIAQDLATRFHGDARVVADDVLRLCRQLAADGLLVAADE
jgi:hypothetical protein